jgi:hypothetical protein
MSSKEITNGVYNTYNKIYKKQNNISWCHNWAALAKSTTKEKSERKNKA